MAAKVPNPSGKKRPQISHEGRYQPLPWIAGEQFAPVTLSYVDRGRADQATNHNICIICGEYNDDGRMYALLNGKPAASPVPFGAPTATHGHPECLLKAALFCPHLKGSHFVVSDEMGTNRMTTDQLREYVKQRGK